MKRNRFSLVLLCLGMNAGIALGQNGQPQTPKYIRDSILLPTGDGAFITVMTTRKYGVIERLPAIFQFTIYARRSDSLKTSEAADRGYVGVMAYSRGKWNSPGQVLAYETDGRDAYAVIDWISKQPWSDGRVGMYGGSYNGFTQWAATKKLHPALRTIVPSAAVAPGLDVPMTNNVQMSFVFPWTYYTGNDKFLDQQDYGSNYWRGLYWRWYEAGLPYRQLDSLTGRGRNEMFQRWVAHPSYDKYWQEMIPYRQDFAHINIPILSTTGYYDGGQVGGMYYYRELQRFNPQADQYVLIGPYGHFGSQGYPDSVYNGYAIDPVARINIHEIIYDWFAYVLKGGPKPTILKDRFNFEIMGANKWEHVPSLQQMANDTMRLFPDRNRLEMTRPSSSGSHAQVIDFKNREEVRGYYFMDRIIYDSLTVDGLVFRTPPLTDPVTISGAFSGELKLRMNKKDLDYHVLLFEEMEDGRYFFLSYFMGRASYAASAEKRVLLKPGKRQSIRFSNTYITSKRLDKGSRIVVVLDVNKSPFEQVNYGTGKAVSDESIRDANEPLRISWYNDSYINLPILK